MPIPPERLLRDLFIQHTQPGLAATYVDGYDKNGLRMKPIQPLTIFKDQDVVTRDQWWKALTQGATALLSQATLWVIVGISDSFKIPENNWNAPIDRREGRARLIGKDPLGFDIFAKKETGDPGNQYYEFPPGVPIPELLEYIKLQCTQKQETVRAEKKIGGYTRQINSLRSAIQQRRQQAKENAAFGVPYVEEGMSPGGIPFLQALVEQAEYKMADLLKR